MPWQWVNDIREHGQRKKAHNWSIRCPYFGGSGRNDGCPSNYPFRGANKPRMKFVQKMCLFTYEYRCLDCGCLSIHSIETPNDENDLRRINPAFYGRKADYKFHV